MVSHCCKATVVRGKKLAQAYHKFYCTRCQRECQVVKVDKK